MKLTVVGGAGSGSYAPGATVYVEPYRMPDMRAFEHWAGPLPDTVDWTARARAHLSFPMPPRDTVVTATFRSAPLWSLPPVAVGGTTVFLQLPAQFYGLRGGLLVLLHDAGSGADYWRHSPEARLFERAAVAAGHGLLVLESSDRVNGRWDTGSADLAQNLDLQHLLAALHADGQIGGAPAALVGVGQGGDFASLAARALAPLSSVHVVATVLIGSAGGDGPAAGAAPALFVLSERDDAALNDRARARRQALEAAGVPSEEVKLGPWPIFPTRFWRIDGVSLLDSKSIYKVLWNVGAIDAVGRVTTDPAQMADPGLPDHLRPLWPAVSEQLNVGWAGHGFSSHATELILDFAQQHWGLPVPMPTASPTRRAYLAYVEVIHGSKGRSDFGGGTEAYIDRDVVHIWADPDPPGQVFDRWTGDANQLADPWARHTSFRVTSAGSHRFVATYRPAQERPPAARQIDGRAVLVAGPPDPIGVIAFFHDAGGYAADWTTARSVEGHQLLRDALARGYAVLALESGDRLRRRWSADEPVAGTADGRHVRAVLAQLAAEGTVPTGVPRFAIGRGDVGNFGARLADTLGWQAAAVYAGSCQPRLAATTSVPIAWALAVQDREASNQDAHACHTALRARGVPSELWLHHPSPLYAERFGRIPGVSAATSRAVYEALRAGRIVDRLDRQLLPPEESAWLDAIDGLPEYDAVAPAVAEQLDVCWSSHRFFSDLDYQVLDFFDRQRGAPPTAPPRPATATATPHVTPDPRRTPAAVYLPAAYDRR